MATNGVAWFSSVAGYASEADGASVSRFASVAAAPYTQPAYAQLFANGEKGFAYPDMSDFSGLFQDTAGTTPITAVGQTVKRVTDRSGNGCDLVSTGGLVLGQDGGGFYYLTFNGTSSASVTSQAIDLSGTNKVSYWAGVYKTADPGFGCILETASITANGSFNLFASAGQYAPALIYTGGPGFNQAALTTYTAPIKNVLAINLDLSTATQTSQIVSRVNTLAGTQTFNGAAAPTNNFISQLIYVGARGGASLFWSGRLYSLILRGAATTGTAQADIETYVNSKTGAY